MVFDLKIGLENDLSLPGVTEGLPDWTGDGKKLVFWYLNPKKPQTTKLYVMNPDGSQRKMIPLPRKYRYSHPSCFPNEGSSDKTRIIFAGTKAIKK